MPRLSPIYAVWLSLKQFFELRLHIGGALKFTKREPIGGLKPSGNVGKQDSECGRRSLAHLNAR